MALQRLMIFPKLGLVPLSLNLRELRGASLAEAVVLSAPSYGAAPSSGVAAGVSDAQVLVLLKSTIDNSKLLPPCPLSDEVMNELINPIIKLKKGKVHELKEDEGSKLPVESSRTHGDEAQESPVLS